MGLHDASVCRQVHGAAAAGSGGRQRQRDAAREHGRAQRAARRQNQRYRHGEMNLVSRESGARAEAAPPSAAPFGATVRQLDAR
jgi:hypothetical protein